jgi:3-isopropylmalate/(R)-2-methylmalate dehydratase small subunit
MEAGRAWVLGDRIDTDVLAPGSLMKLPARVLASHCLKAVRPEFAAGVQPGDVLVAGESFGVGSSREQAAESLRLLGVKAVLAKSFARIFYRNAFNLGLPAIVLAQADEIADGDAVAVDLAGGVVENRSSGKRYDTAPIPQHLLSIVAAGGLMAYMKRRLQVERGTSP